MYTLGSSDEIGSPFTGHWPLATVAQAGTFQWVDETGAIHFTDNLLAIPEEHRRGVVKRKTFQERSLPTPSSTMADTSDAQSAAFESPDSHRVSRETSDQVSVQDEQARWRQRLSETRKKIEELRAKKLKLSEEMELAQYGMWLTFGPGASDLETREALPAMQKALEALNKEIQGLEHDLRVRIPDEARRAGVPPGWLR